MVLPQDVEKGLAYRKSNPSTGAPTASPCSPTSKSSGALLAVIRGATSTSGTTKITDYAQELLDDLDKLAAGPRVSSR